MEGGEDRPNDEVELFFAHVRGHAVFPVVEDKLGNG